MANLNKKMLMESKGVKSKKELAHQPEDLDDLDDDDEDDLIDENEDMQDEGVVQKKMKGCKIDTVIMKTDPKEKLQNMEKAIYGKKNKGNTNNKGGNNNNKKKKKFN